VIFQMPTLPAAPVRLRGLAFLRNPLPNKGATFPARVRAMHARGLAKTADSAMIEDALAGQMFGPACQEIV
jgi:hypothetical protein